MVVAISLGESISVQVEAEGTYAPDIMSDLCARACELFGRAITASRQPTAE